MFATIKHAALQECCRYLHNSTIAISGQCPFESPACHGPYFDVFRWIRVLPSSGVCPQPGFGRGFGLGRSRAKPQSENGLALTRFYLQTTSVAHSSAGSKEWRTDRPQVRTEGCEDTILQQSGALFAHRSTKFLRFSFSVWS